jgi:hypothetical protein
MASGPGMLPAWGEGREGGRRHQVLLRRSPCRSCRRGARGAENHGLAALVVAAARVATARSPASMAGGHHQEPRAHPLVSRRRVGRRAREGPAAGGKTGGVGRGGCVRIQQRNCFVWSLVGFSNAISVNNCATNYVWRRLGR